MESQVTIPEKTLDNRRATVFLGEGCNKINQALYSSQLYGTFFGVDGVFEVEKISETKRRITSIKLNVLNYKGTINIGLIRAEWNSTHNRIEFAVRGMADPRKIVEVDFKGSEMIFSRGDELKMLRKLELLNVPDKTQGADMQKLYVFDSEFFDRDGDLKFPLIRYEELEGPEIEDNLKHEENKKYLKRQKNDLEPVIPKDEYGKISIMRPGRRCVPALLTIRF